MHGTSIPKHNNPTKPPNSTTANGRAEEEKAAAIRAYHANPGSIAAIYVGNEDLIPAGPFSVDEIIGHIQGGFVGSDGSGGVCVFGAGGGSTDGRPLLQIKLCVDGDLGVGVWMDDNPPWL